MAQHHIFTKERMAVPALTLSWGKSIGKHRCREAVPETGRWPGFNQCVRVGTVCEEVNGEQMWFCAQHSSAKQNEREAKRTAKYKADTAKIRAKWAAERNAPKFRAALEQIAAGHNDARGLADEVLRDAG